MLNNNKFRLNNDMKKYISETTKKSIEKSIEKYILKKDPMNFNVNKMDEKNKDYYILLPFVSILSFFAGYHYKRISSI